MTGETIDDLAMLRRSDGLFVLRVERRATDDGDRYLEECVPLPEREHRDLAAAWHRLAAVKEIEPWVLEAVTTVLRETVADPLGDRPALPSLAIEPPPSPHKPTAANPRAYRGTKDRPPKPRRPDPVDLRPFLCVVGGQDRLLTALTGRLGAVDLPAEERAGPAGFRREFEWRLRRQPAAVRSAALAAYHGLGLDVDAELRRAVVYMFAAFPATAGAWCEFLAAIEPARRQPMLDVIWARGAPPFDVGPVLTQLCAADQLTSDVQFPARLAYAIERCVVRGDAFEDLLAAFELLDERPVKDLFDLADRPPSSLDRLAIADFADRVEAVEGGLVRDLVQACGRVPGTGTLLQHLARAELPAEQIRDLACTMWVLWDDPYPAQALRDLQRHLPACLAAMAKLPDSYRGKAVATVRQFIWENSTDALGLAARLCEVVCRPPLAETSELEIAVEVFALLPSEHWDAVVAAPAASFRTLEDRTQRRNDAHLIAYGFDGLIDGNPQLLVDGFRDAPAALCRAARLLGLLSGAVRRELVSELMASPLGGEADALSSRDAAATVACIDALGGEVKRHVPRQLRRHVNGDLDLDAGQVIRHLRKIEQSWPALRCDALAQLALGRLRNGLIDGEATDIGDLSGEITHALMLQARADENRRVLRRLIRACYAGDAGFVAAHPLNQAWLTAHSKIPAAVWSEGVQLGRDLAGVGKVDLALETDPLEALRLGTYVGSCLGVGGGFAYSAAATVLDINKQVVFARDAKGRFLARQIVAITQDDRLACYGIYPKVDVALQELFRDFDLALARALGVEVFVEPDEDDEDDEDKDDEDEDDEDEDDDGYVALIVAKDWWDDSCWDLQIDGD